MTDKKKPKLHELLAVEPERQNTATAMVDEAKVAFTKKTERFRGLLTTTNYFDVTRSQENTSENKLLVETVGGQLDYAVTYVKKWYDALLQKEATNQHAKADLIVDGVTIGTDIPATFLLGMETRLRNFRDTVLVVPTNDPALDWHVDDTASVPGVFKAAPVKRMKTEKKLMHKVLSDATDKHPAQIEKWHEDVPVAEIILAPTSGMWTPLRKATVIARIDAVLIAVKQARQRANDTDVVQVTIADKMFDFIFKA